MDFEVLKNFFQKLITYSKPFTRWCIITLSRITPPHYAHSKWGHRFVNFILFQSLRDDDEYEEYPEVKTYKSLFKKLEELNRIPVLDIYLKVNPVNIIKAFTYYALKLSHWHSQYIILSSRKIEDDYLKRNFESITKYLNEALFEYRLFGHGFTSPEVIDKLIYALIDIDISSGKVVDIEFAEKVFEYASSFLEKKLGNVKTCVYTGGGIHILVHIEDKVIQPPKIIKYHCSECRRCLINQNCKFNHRDLLMIIRSLYITEQVIKKNQHKIIKPILQELMHYLTNKFKINISIDFENSLISYIRIPETTNRKYGVKTKLIYLS